MDAPFPDSHRVSLIYLLRKFLVEWESYVPILHSRYRYHCRFYSRDLICITIPGIEYVMIAVAMVHTLFLRWHPCRTKLPRKALSSKTILKWKVQGPPNGGVSNGGVSRSGLVLPFLSFLSFFLSFLVLFGTFPIFPGFSRFARRWSGDFPDSSLFSFSAD